MLESIPICDHQKLPTPPLCKLFLCWYITLSVTRYSKNDQHTLFFVPGFCSLPLLKKLYIYYIYICIYLLHHLVFSFLVLTSMFIYDRSPQDYHLIFLGPLVFCISRLFTYKSGLILELLLILFVASKNEKDWSHVG